MNDELTAQLERAAELYMAACYGAQKISTTQAFEVRQAFLSGIHWLNTQQDEPDTDLISACQYLTMHQRLTPAEKKK